MHIIGVDPGKNCGWATFRDGINEGVGVAVGDEEIWDFIDSSYPDVWVVEDYKIRSQRHGGFDHEFQSVFPAQVIGAIKYKAAVHKELVVLQQPTIKRPAMGMLAGKAYQKKANNHALDAYLHAVYYIHMGAKK